MTDYTNGTSEITMGRPWILPCAKEQGTMARNESKLLLWHTGFTDPKALTLNMIKHHQDCDTTRKLYFSDVSMSVTSFSILGRVLFRRRGVRCACSMLLSFPFFFLFRDGFNP
jgi:hypothetical protein